MTWVDGKFLTAMPEGAIERPGRVYRGLGLREIVPSSRQGKRPAIWAVTHIGTGHRVCLPSGTEAEILPVVTQIAELGDWNFTGLEGWRNAFPDIVPKLNAVFAEHADMFRVQGKIMSANQAGTCPEIAQAIAYANLGVVGAA